MLSSTGTNDFFSPFSVAGFSGYCSVLCSPHVPVSLISPVWPLGCGCQPAGDRSRGVAGGVLTAPRRSSAGAAQSWHPPWHGRGWLGAHGLSAAATPRVITLCGARGQVCHMSHVSPNVGGYDSGLLVCPGILPVIIIIALTLSVLTRDALSSHVCLSVTKPDSIVMNHFCHSSNSFRLRLL